MGSFRNYNFAQNYLRHFEKVFVATLNKKDHFAKDGYIPLHAFGIIPLPCYDYKKLTSKVFLESKTKISQKKGGPIKSILKLISGFPFNLIIGEGGIVYIFSGYQNLKKIIQPESITHLQSSYSPIADHIICYLLKKKFPNLIWVADFRDLQVEDTRKDVFFPRLQNWFTRTLIKQADRLTTVSEGLKKALQKFDKPVHVLHNGAMSYADQKEKVNTTKFTLSYTGSLYSEFQRPQLFFEAIAQLFAERQMNRARVKILYRGKDELLWQSWIDKYKLNNCSDVTASIPHNEAIAIQKSSHINLLLSWSSKDFTGILTGKFFEYLEARRPVLLIINGSQDEEFERIFESTNIGLIQYTHNDVNQIKGFILEKYNQWQNNGDVKNEVNEDEIQKFQWPVMMEKFIPHLNL